MWMRPDKKSIQIAALMTQVETLKQNIASGTSGAAYTTDSLQGNSRGSFQRNELAERRYTHTGCDHVNKDGKDWYWCAHESHKRDLKCTSGFYCTTHGKGHPEHDHAYSFLLLEKGRLHLPIHLLAPTSLIQARFPLIRNSNLLYSCALPALRPTLRP